MSRPRSQKADTVRLGATLAQMEREKAELETLVDSMRCVLAYYEEHGEDDESQAARAQGGEGEGS